MNAREAKKYLCLCFVVGRTTPPYPLKDVLVLIPETCDHVILHVKRDFADVIKLWILRWREIILIIWVDPI